MKKIICLVLSLMLLTGTIASAAGLDFMTDGSLRNYKAVSTYSVELDVPVEFINEFVEGTDIENYVDIKSIIEGIAGNNQTAKVSMKMSEDYKRIEMSVEREDRVDVKFNANLDVSVNARSGMWLNLDIRDTSNAKFELVYTTATMNKYVTLDVLEMMEMHDGAQAKAEFVQMLDMLLDREMLEPVILRNRELVEQFATVRTDLRKCTVHFDSAGFSDYVAHLINEFIDVGVYMDMLTPEEADEVKQNILLYGKKISVLGEEGCTIEYSLTGKNALQKMSMVVDVELCLKDIYTILSDDAESWPFESDGRISLTVRQVTDVKLSGDSVRVTYPALTPENSITYAELYDLEPEEEWEEEVYEESYPLVYFSLYPEELPIIDGQIYLPLRAVLDEAYLGDYSIEFTADETLLLSGKWMPGDIQTKIGATTATIDGTEVEVGEVILYNGTTTYVSTQFFEELFGWSLCSATYDVLYDYYYCLFYNDTYMME